MTTWLIALLALTLGQPYAHALEGRWVADLAASRLHAGTAVRSIALTFVVRSDRVRISDEVVAASGEQVGHGPAEFITDGQPHPNDALLPGVMAQARWTNPRRLDTVLTRSRSQIRRYRRDSSRHRRRTRWRADDETVRVRRARRVRQDGPSRPTSPDRHRRARSWRWR